MRIAVLRGGPSHEHDVSLWSGEAVLRSLGDRAIDVTIGRDGVWCVDGQLQPDFRAALTALSDVDVVFIALHGPFGEDGTLQALLETAGLRYTGSGHAASALAMDKIRTKFTYAGAKLPTAPFVPHLDGDPVASTVSRVQESLSSPWVVKPARDGSSFGVVFAGDAAELAAALASIGDGEAVVETRIVGRELTCGVIESEAGLPEPLPVTELIPRAGHAFFDFDAKYTPGETTEVTPADIDASLKETLQSLAVVAHRTLGCRHLSRTDFMVGTDGTISLLETNTIPGLTKTSLVPQAAAVAGLSFDELVERLVERAMATPKSRRTDGSRRG